MGEEDAGLFELWDCPDAGIPVWEDEQEEVLRLLDDAGLDELAALLEEA